MTGSTHRLGGIVAGMLVINMLYPDISTLQSIGVIAVSTVGSLIPDIDNPRSTISLKVPGVRFFVSALQKIIRIIAELLPGQQKKYIRSVVGHRGISHSLLMIISSYALLKWLTIDWIAAGVSAGMISHIVLDVFAGGVPLFAPLTTKRVTLGNIKTGGSVEWFFRTAATVIILLYFLHMEGKWNLI